MKKRKSTADELEQERRNILREREYWKSVCERGHLMDIEKLIEDLRGLLKQYGEKIPYGELVGAPWPYSRAGDLVWQDPEPYFIEQAATALSTIQAENAKLRAELEKAKAEFEEERAAVVDVDKAILWLKDYVFEDSRKIYTNGSRLIPYFRVLQAFRDKAYNGLQEGRE